MVIPNPPASRQVLAGAALAGAAAGLWAGWLAASEPAVVGGRPVLGFAAAFVAGGALLAAVGALGLRGRRSRGRGVMLLIVGAALAVGSVAGWAWRFTRPSYVPTHPAHYDPASNER
ncbi:MAG TPA: hypothetical protein VF785_08580 [Gemmatimonadaceae bacterium]